MFNSKKLQAAIKNSRPQDREFSREELSRLAKAAGLILRKSRWGEGDALAPGRFSAEEVEIPVAIRWQVSVQRRSLLWTPSLQGHGGAIGLLDRLLSQVKLPESFQVDLSEPVVTMPLPTWAGIVTQEAWPDAYVGTWNTLLSEAKDLAAEFQWQVDEAIAEAENTA